MNEITSNNKSLFPLLIQTTAENSNNILEDKRRIRNRSNTSIDKLINDDINRSKSACISPSLSQNNMLSMSSFSGSTNDDSTIPSTAKNEHENENEIENSTHGLNMVSLNDGTVDKEQREKERGDKLANINREQVINVLENRPHGLLVNRDNTSPASLIEDPSPLSTANNSLNNNGSGGIMDVVSALNTYRSFESIVTINDLENNEQQEYSNNVDFHEIITNKTTIKPVDFTRNNNRESTVLPTVSTRIPSSSSSSEGSSRGSSSGNPSSLSRSSEQGSGSRVKGGEQQQSSVVLERLEQYRQETQDLVTVLIAALTALDQHTNGELSGEFASTLMGYMMEELDGNTF